MAFVQSQDAQVWSLYWLLILMSSESLCSLPDIYNQVYTFLNTFSCFSPAVVSAGD